MGGGALPAIELALVLVSWAHHHHRPAHAGAAPVPSLGFAATLGDNMVLQASPAQAIVWGPLGTSASSVSVSWQETSSNFSSGEVAPPVVAKTLEWLGLQIWTAKLPPIDHSFTEFTITATPDKGTPVTIANVTFGEVWVRLG
jgi:hypothetical protein